MIDDYCGYCDKEERIKELKEELESYKKLHFCWQSKELKEEIHTITNQKTQIWSDYHDMKKERGILKDKLAKIEKHFTNLDNSFPLKQRQPQQQVSMTKLKEILDD